MSKYNPNDLVLWNEYAKAKHAGVVRWPSSHEFSIERTFSQEEKTEMIDTYFNKHGEGVFSYMVSLVDKWLEERNSLPIDADGWVRTNSLKAWLHKNDPRRIVDDYYHYGNFTIYEEIFGLDTNTKNEAHNRLKDYETIRKLFHHCCVMQCIAEECIYLEQDPKAIKFSKVRQYARRYDEFRVQMLCDFAHNMDSETIADMDEKLLDEVLAKFEAYDAIHQKFEKEFAEIAKNNSWRE